jgi:hypothetical protein
MCASAPREDRVNLEKPADVERQLAAVEATTAKTRPRVVPDAKALGAARGKFVTRLATAARRKAALAPTWAHADVHFASRSTGRNACETRVPAAFAVEPT